MAFSSGSEGGAPMAEINVTPLVDVMLVLLIIFMITTPLMQHKVEVKLPETSIGQVDDAGRNKAPPVTIAVLENGTLFWNDEPVTRDLLESRLAVEAQKTPQPIVNVRGDKTTKYRVVNEVVKTAQAQGMRKVGFMTVRER